jgi:hypothetical protein
MYKNANSRHAFISKINGFQFRVTDSREGGGGGNTKYKKVAREHQEKKQ